MDKFFLRRVQTLAAAAVLAAGFFFFPTATKAQTAGLKINASVPGVSGTVAVRAIIRQSNGNFFPGEWGASSWPNVMLRGKAVGPGMTLQLPAGTTVITVGKGPDYIPQTFTVNLVSGQTTTINAVLEPVFNMRGNGWVSGDIHAHYNHGEGEILRAPAQVHNMCAAGGMNFISLCQEHFGATTLTRTEMFDVWSQFDSTECQVWLGAEEPKNAWGHHASLVNDPWRIRSPLPYYTGIHEVHRQNGVVIPVHPMRQFPGKHDGQNWGLYPLHNFYKAYPLQALTGNLLDGWSGLSDEAFHPRILPPYFELLDMGYRIPFLADSDIAFDRVNNGLKAPGNWVNYFHLEGKPFSKNAVIDAIKKGRVVSTSGPMLLFDIDNGLPGTTVAPNGTQRMGRIRASYSFNPWTLAKTSFNGEPCRIVQIDLFRNGKVIQSWAPNTPTATLTFPINESSGGAYYMVRVLGNDAQWMAAYSSPIYFDDAPRPRQPASFTPLVNGRVYDAANGAPIRASVNCVRDGQTLWTLETDAQGLFRAYVPLDARLVASDANGRQISRDILNDEKVYAFCHNLPDNFPDLTGSITAFRNLIQEMKWEFPLGHKNAASYVQRTLSGSAAMTDFRIQSAPAPTPGKGSTEITTLIVDKTRAQPGDTINYAVLFRTPHGGQPNEELSVEWKSWDPNYPRFYTKHGKTFHQSNGANTLIPIGNGFFLRQGSVVVPAWAGNINSTSPGLKMAVTVRGNTAEEANLLIYVGATRPELLISSTWDGFPATWGEFGVGPAYFHRQLSVNARYSDYRRLHFSFQMNGQNVSVQPIADTAHSSDADDAVFEDYFFYDAQFGPQYRNIPFRDPVRGQPAEPDYGVVPVFNPQDRNQNGEGIPRSLVNLPIANEWFGQNQGNEKIVYWQHSSGYMAGTFLSHSNFISAQFLRGGLPVAAGWQAKAVADMNGDGAPDIIWQSATGLIAVWFMRGTEFISSELLRNGARTSSGWNLVASGDISGDGKNDLIWQHANRSVAAWLMNGTTYGTSTYLRGSVAVPPAWRLSGVADLDRNGSADLLWHHATGPITAWLMNQTSFQNTSSLRSVGSSWQLVGTADFNGDGREDFLWQNKNGQMAVWFMDGSNYLDGKLMLDGKSARTGWRVIGAK